MYRVRRFNSVLLCLCLLLWLTGGCGWLGSGRVSETSDPHYRLGVNRRDSGNFDGAIAAFEKAIQTNPYSAAAHSQLGWIYYQYKNDPAAAIYHFRKYEQYTQDKNNAESIANYIEFCKQQLARDVSLVPVNDAKLLDDYKELNRKKLELDDRILQLRAENTRLQNQVRELSQNASSSLGSTTDSNADISSGSTSNANPTDASPPSQVSRPSQSRSVVSTPGSYTIRKGDTFSSIGRRFNLSVGAIQSANPGVNPRRLQTGQTIKLPSR